MGSANQLIPAGTVLERCITLKLVHTSGLFVLIPCHPLSPCRALRPGDLYALPAGWDTSPEGRAHVVLLLVARTSFFLDGYCVAVVNTGEGSEYHPTVAIPPAAEMRQVMAFP